MELTISILLIFLSIIVGYLLGSISPGIIIGKVFFKQDPRELGSHNSGGTNVGRIFGKKVGLIVIILDALKSLISIWTMYLITKYCFTNYTLIMGHTYFGFISGFACCIGHTFPIFNKFKGGKAVSCFLGIMIGVNYGLTIIGAIIYFIILKIKKYVSLSSILVSLILPFLALIPIFKYTMCLNMEYHIIYFPLFVLTIGLFVVIRHKDNIKRLINHEESKIKWLK